MHYALIDNKKTEAKTGLEALCPGCLQPVIPKCGTKKVHHWAHRSTVMCDSWWEPETDWHRLWKNNFPAECQEIFLPDERTGEKHIADVRNSHGLIIEFQHSHITPEERASREKFYKNMIWVVDGTRLIRDYPRLLKGMRDCFRSTGIQGFFFAEFLDECFPSNWIDSKVPVIFDFQLSTSSTEPEDTMREPLWCLFPKLPGRSSIVAVIKREDFIAIILNEAQFKILQRTPYEIIGFLENNHRQQQQNSQMENLWRAAQRKEAWRRRGRRF